MIMGKDYVGVGCGALIINDAGETLLIQRSAQAKNEAGFWSKPGGSVEYGETVEEAVIREIKEELDVDIKILDFINYTDHIIMTESQHWVAFNFLAKIVNGEPNIMEPNKCSEIKWFSLDDLPKNITQTTIEPINEYLKNKGV